MILKNSCTYQGYAVQSVKFRRTEGFSPETGYVDLRLEDLKTLLVDVKPVPWRNFSGQEVSGQLDIARVAALFPQVFKGGGAGNTVVTGAGQKRQSGLAHYGDLVMQTSVDGQARPPMTYNDIYVASEGIEEVTQNLAKVRSHSEGLVRIPLTDIRQFYKDHAHNFCRINYHLRSGKYDPLTVQPDGTPWSIKQVVTYLFSQLPGSPAVDSKSDLFNLTQGPPTDIPEDAPVVSILEGILEQCSLVARMLPDGRYAVLKRWQTRLKGGQFISIMGKGPENLDAVHYEKRTVTITDRPPLVQVIGKKRVARITMGYVPIIQWIDSRYYFLYDIGKLLPGYDINMVNNQVLNNEGKNFQDVYQFAKSFSAKTGPTAAGGGGEAGNGPLAESIVQLLRKWAYKGYAPAGLFRPQEASDTPKQGKSVDTVVAPAKIIGEPPSSFSDDDSTYVPFLPAVDAPWYKTELANNGVKIPISKEQGDAGDLILLQPVVNARSIGERFFTNSKEMNAYFDRRIAHLKTYIEEIKPALNAARDRARGLAQILKRAEKSANQSVKKNVLQRAYDVIKVAATTGIVGVALQQRDQVQSAGGDVVIQIGQEVQAAASSVGTPILDNELLLNKIDGGEAAITQMVFAATEAKKWQQILDEEQAKEKAIDGERALYQNRYGSLGGIAVRANLETGPIPSGKFSFDNKTGILLFSEPMCHARSSLVMSDEAQVVAADGGVHVTFGYEVNTNGVEDWTSVLVSPQDQQGGAAIPVVAGYNRPSGIKAKIERAPGMRLYMDEKGFPMNITAVTETAIRKATAQVAKPKTVEGFVDIASGFVRCVLDGGINCVMHEWDGAKEAQSEKATCHTWIYINAPGSVGPLGPSDVPTVDPRSMKERLSIKQDRERL